MAKQNSFDIVSKIDLAEVKNAVNQALKEIHQRYDLKNTDSDIELQESDGQLTLASRDDFTLKAVNEVLQQRLVRRGISLKALTYGEIQPAAKDTVRQTVTMQQGIPTETGKGIIKLIKKEKIKVQASIHEDMVRVSGKDRDKLQEVIALLKDRDFDIDMQFTNFRSL